MSDGGHHRRKTWREVAHATTFADRIVYARRTKSLMQKTPVTGGIPITQEWAIGLKTLVFGSPTVRVRQEWLRTGLQFREPETNFGYGLRVSRNSIKAMVMCLQVYVLKHLLFDKRVVFAADPEAMLKPSRNRQQEALSNAIADILWKAGETTRCCIFLPQEESYVTEGPKYVVDGTTEKLHLFEFNKEEDARTFIKKYLYLFQQDPGPGCILLVYSAMMSRGLERVKEDLQVESSSLLTPVGDCTQSIVNLFITGSASPYLHNGIIYGADAHSYGKDQVGIALRSEVGFLLWDQTEQKTRQNNLGSRLKTPLLPLWVTCCNDQYGVLFNPNRDLMRDYHAEHKFELHYYNSSPYQMEPTILTIDTRPHRLLHKGQETGNSPILEKLITTKWEEACINWNGTGHFV